MSLVFFDEDWETTPIAKPNEGELGELIQRAFPPREDDQPVNFVWEKLPHQIAPDWLWDLWILFGGRGTGKTDGGAAWFNEHMSGPPCDPRIAGGHKAAIIAPTLGDAYQSCVIGPSGLKAHNPKVVDVARKSGQYVIWPNGAQAKLFGAYTKQDIERLRAGGNNCAFWGEEFAAWVRLRPVWDQLQFGLRIGTHPRGILTTTPKNRKLLRELLEDPATAMTHGTTDDNPHLPERQKKKLKKKYAGTRLGKQELEGRILEDVPGAVTTVDKLQAVRLAPGDHPEIERRIAVVDPSTTNTETSDQAGIAIAGKSGDHVYQFADASLKAAVADWAYELVSQAVKWECSEIWYESNGGSDTFEIVINDAIKLYNENLEKAWLAEFGHLPKKERPTCPKVTFRVKPVPASMSKRDRAVALEMAIEQGRWHPMGDFPELEDQLTTWVPGEDETDDNDNKIAGKKTTDSPNNMDAAVHAYRILIGLSGGKGKTGGSALRNARLPGS